MLRNRLAHKLIQWLPSNLQLLALTQLGLINGAVDPEMKQLTSFLPEDRRKIALDVGANNGVTSMVLSRAFRTVYSFEPNSELLNSWINSKPSNVICNQCAISDYTGDTTLRVPICNGQRLTGWASLESPLVGESYQEIVVKRITLDSFIDNSLFAEIDFIKIDVEGHELAVLRGAQNILKTSRPFILAETNTESDSLSNFLDSFNYRPISRLNAGEIGLTSFSSQNTLFIPKS